jgi:hypothetical protein
MTKITLYPTEDAQNGELNPFIIELDGLTEEQYHQKAARGLYKNSITGTALSSRCIQCGHVHLGQLPAECDTCGSIRFATKHTNETWNILEADGVPEHLLDDCNPLPAFWDWLEEKEANTVDTTHFEEVYIHPDDIENTYRVEYLTANEVMAEFADADGFDNIYPDHLQDWPEHRPEPVFYPRLVAEDDDFAIA